MRELMGMIAMSAVLVLTALLAILWRSYLRETRRQNKNFAQLTDRLAQTQQQSFHYKNELNAILSSMVEGVMVIGRDEKILYVSPNVSNMFELRSRDVALKAYWEVVPHQQINDCIEEALRDKMAVNREVSLIGPQDVFFSMQISPVLQQGKLTSVVAVFHDITELKRLIKTRSEFVANVSHELKTPLTSIKGFVETLSEEDGLEDAESARRFLAIIHKQTQRLEILVDDLLTISALESKPVKMNLTPLDARPVIQSVVLMYKKAIDAAGHKVEMEFPEAFPQVYADRHRLEQVFINLLDNAVKFTPHGGIIMIKGHAQAPFVRIDVTDSGEGITPEHLSRIFERFYRVDKARARATGGTGLGLAIVKHIVLAHQGKIEAQSSPQGSTFSVFLPLIK